MTVSTNVHRIHSPERELILIGTAHLSQASTQEVIDMILLENPDTVCVELCNSRYEALSQPDRWRNTNVYRVVKDGKTMLLLANLILAAFQKKIGDKLGLEPGKEMLEAVNAARKINAEIVLADRDVQTTLRKTWRSLGFWEKNKVFSQMLSSLFVNEEISAEEIERIKESDALSEAMDNFAKESPKLKQILIDERDQYLAEKIKTAPGKKVVAVVGAGHVQGIKLELDKTHDLEELTRIPPPGPWGSIFKWGLPAIILIMLGYGFIGMGEAVSLEMIKRWVLWTGTLSALGALAAWGHPVTIISAFLAAPLTTLHPALAAGWVAGLVEATMHKPQVLDFEKLSTDITHLKGFWQNKITRILLVVVFCNIGASLGFFLAGISIASLL